MTAEEIKLRKLITAVRRAARAAGAAVLTLELTAGQWRALEWARRQMQNKEAGAKQPGLDDLAEIALRDLLRRLVIEEKARGKTAPKEVYDWLAQAENRQD